MDSGDLASTTLDGIRRDDKFYLPDGNVTILVSSTLFRVHKHIIARDGSTFENMFSLPMDTDMDSGKLEPAAALEEAGAFVQDGRDDAHPIVMQGDSEVQFRDLLWSLYAL